MAKAALTPEEEKLKKLLATLSMVSNEDLASAEADVLLVKKYGGDIGFKQRLIDLSLVHQRQLDAIERSLGVKKKKAADAKASKQEDEKPEDGYIDISRLGETQASKDAATRRFANLKLDAGTVAKKRASSSKSRSDPAEPHGELEDAPPIIEEDESLKGGFVPSWKRKQAQVQEEEPEEEEVEALEPAGAGVQTVEEQEERLKHIIRHIVRSRAHEAILDFLIKRRMNIIEPAEVAKGLSLKERQVRQVLDDLRHAGIIKDIGTHPYALSPGKDDLDDLKFFFRFWQDNRWHSKILKWVLDHEKG